jgi:hypothetical protein
MIGAAILAAGLPQDTEWQFCNATRGSCYIWRTGSAVSAATTTCAGLGGYMVALNSYEEQLNVETYFTGECAKLHQQAWATSLISF